MAHPSGFTQRHQGPFGISGIRRYVALINQSGVADPVATVLENSLGAEITWVRSSKGVYTGTLGGDTVSTKTVTFTNNGSLLNTIMAFYRNNGNDFVLECFDPVIGDWQDLGTISVPISVEIILYP